MQPALVKPIVELYLSICLREREREREREERERERESERERGLNSFIYKAENIVF